MQEQITQHYQLNYYKQSKIMNFPTNPTNGQTTIVNKKLYTYNTDVQAWLVEGSSDPLVVTEYMYDHLPGGIKRSILITEYGRDTQWDNVRAARDSKIDDIEWRYNRFYRNERLSLPQVDSITALDAYMQALADITNQSDPYNIVWPSLSVA
jgi:hypothetical protein